MKLLVLDIGGTDIKYSVMDENENFLFSGVTATPTQDLSTLLDKLESLYREHAHEVAGIAVSMPGIIDSDAGFCYTGGILEFNQNQPFAKLLSERCGCPVHIDNDGKCAALAEHVSGALRDCQNGAVFLIGTGVGGGLIVNGKLMRGKHFSAGEFSYLSINHAKWGGIDTLAGFCCATTGFLDDLRAAKQIPADVPLNGRDAFAMIHAGDEVAQKVLQGFTDRIAFMIYNFQQLLDLEYVAIGGGISRQDLLIESINESFDRLVDTAFPPLKALISKTVKIVRCQYGSEANQVGALQSYLQWQKENAHG